ncbi:MAG: peptidyl-prolyl cis-trans isomerase [Proteobacteria bacterium]|jgi:peptidyl-prolyl cis-trans isomerase B (cyclophilin B)|nr:peptidyl-prolyl cis-trans isomerase [Pseudomonadota bacterium]MCG6935722.1 peptidyl-prolyl cis-trans isomerase [Pseudomonadota bacterium]
MKRIITLLSLLLTLTIAIPGQAASTNPQVKVDTSLGSFVLELYPDKAPKTVANFLDYVKSGFYTGTIFHRVIDGFMIQGGGFTEDYTRKQTNPAIMNEADNGLKNSKGTIAMARTSEPHSATSQFFINVNNNDFLDHTAKTPRGWGYTVFGKVIKGMDTVNKIRKVETGPGGPFPKDAPRQPVVINGMTLIGADASKK